MFRTLSVAVLFQLTMSAAWACDGQLGKVIFEDTFSDDSGGWEQTQPQAVITPPDFLFSLDAKFVNMSSQNLTFHATEGDFCAEGVLPRSLAPDNTLYFGVEFWAKDYANFMLAQVNSAGRVSLYRKASGNWSQVFGVDSAPSFKADPDAVNALRVTAKDGKITVFLNGAQLKAVRAQVPDGDLRFGVFGQYDKIVDQMPAIKIKSFKVTAGQ